MAPGHLLVFGPGYVAGRFAAALGRPTEVVGRRAGLIPLGDDAAVTNAIGGATHILSSVPPGDDGVDPVLARHAAALARAPARWVGYLSSTGVYGDTAGAWVDERAPVGTGRRPARAEADARWLSLHPRSRVFRLPGIYGPGRSPLERVASGRAHRVDVPGQVFSRIHVDDIVAALLASMEAGPAGAYNIADDLPCSQNDVVEAAARLLGLPPPPVVALDDLSPMARGFYVENRRVANGRAKRLLGWRPAYPTYREGLRALSATASPASASTTPPTAVGVQR